MGILDNLQFWKKKDDDPFGDIPKHDSLPPLKDTFSPSQPAGSLPGNTFSDHSQDSGFVQPINREPAAYQQPHDYTSAFAVPQAQHDYGSSPVREYAPQPVATGGYVREATQPSHDSELLRKEMEIISSKLDYLKASLETINKRLDNIEGMSRYEYGQAARRY